MLLQHSPRTSLVMGHCAIEADSVTRKIVSASAGSLLTSLLFTPLDVVKTRMQAPGQSLQHSSSSMLGTLARVGTQPHLLPAHLTNLVSQQANRCPFFHVAMCNMPFDFDVMTAARCVLDLF
jgi:hypothetical protein